MFSMERRTKKHSHLMIRKNRHCSDAVWTVGINPAGIAQAAFCGARAAKGPNPMDQDGQRWVDRLDIEVRRHQRRGARPRAGMA